MKYCHLLTSLIIFFLDYKSILNQGMVAQIAEQDGKIERSWVQSPPGFNEIVFQINYLYNLHGYDGNHINGILDRTDKGKGVRQSFL